MSISMKRITNGSKTAPNDPLIGTFKMSLGEVGGIASRRYQSIGVSLNRNRNAVQAAGRCGVPPQHGFLPVVIGPKMAGVRERTKVILPPPPAGSRTGRRQASIGVFRHQVAWTMILLHSPHGEVGQNLFLMASHPFSILDFQQECLL